MYKHHSLKPFWLPVALEDWIGLFSSQAQHWCSITKNRRLEYLCCILKVENSSNHNWIYSQETVRNRYPYKNVQANGKVYYDYVLENFLGVIDFASYSRCRLRKQKISRSFVANSFTLLRQVHNSICIDKLRTRAHSVSGLTTMQSSLLPWSRVLDSFN